MKKAEFINANIETMKKQELIDTLTALPKVKWSDNLASRIAYTIKAVTENAKKVMASDLRELLVEAQSVCKATPAPAAGLKKPSKPASKKKEEPVDDDTDDEDDESDEEEAPAKKPSKSVNKSGFKTAKAKSKHEDDTFLPIAAMFPEKLTIETDEGKQTLVRCHEKYHDVQELRDALDNEDAPQLYIAAYWTKRHIKQFDYAATFGLMDKKSAPKEFPSDLDILNVVLTCDTMDRVYAMSIYTEAMYRFDKPEFTPVEDADGDGNKFTVRFSNNMEFEVYEVK